MIASKNWLVIQTHGESSFTAIAASRLQILSPSANSWRYSHRRLAGAQLARRLWYQVIEGGTLVLLEAEIERI